METIDYLVSTDWRVGTDLIGTFEIEFMDGKTRILDIKRTLYDYRGEPMYLVVNTGAVYPWRNVISIRVLV